MYEYHVYKQNPADLLGGDLLGITMLCEGEGHNTVMLNMTKTPILFRVQPQLLCVSLGFRV